MDPRKSSSCGGDDDLPLVSSMGSTKSKKKSVVMEEDSSIGMELCEQPKDEEEKVMISGKKKRKKGCSKDLQHNDEDDSSAKISEEISFSGKTKGGGSVNFSLLDVEDYKEEVEDEDEVSPLTLSGKKKKSSISTMKSSNLFSTSFLEEEETETSTCKPDDDVTADEEISEITFSGKKKSVRKNYRSVELGGESMLGREVTEESNNDTNSATKGDEVGETSKSKKKKKNKNGRTAHVEDDFDKILAEFGETPASPVSKVENIQAQREQVAPADDAGAKDGEEETAGSAAAKKKKNKKKKDKDKKEAVSVATSSVENKQENSTSEPSHPKKKDAKGKVVEKKVPKHVREMQEILARRQEAEQRRKKEEEEKLRKEEEERRMEEEQERVAEEIRQKRKMREKEKRQKKKQDGELLTAKQKTKAFKREAFKNMVLPDAGSLLVADRNGDSSKRRPIYGNNKKSARGKANDSASVQVKDGVETKENHADEPGTLHEMNPADDERIHIVESADTSEKHGAVDVTRENGDEKDDWDAKSLDSINFNIKGDSDDKAEEIQPVVKKELKDTASNAHDTGPVTDKPTVKARVAGKPTTAAKEPMPKVDDDTWPKDSSEKGEGSILNEIVEEREENLRSPIICIIGHVDTGKTKLLDCIRGTNVQEGEAGGITQQIGATYFPAENIRERTKELKDDAKLKVPGLLVIDTPGHESFTNLRSRGANLCDLAVLVVDIMHGLEKQTIESLKLLRERNVEFIIALNKVDRLNGWKANKNAPIRKAIKQQSIDAVNDFNTRLTGVITQLKEQGLNTELYYKNREMGETFSIVPTSAISGEGIPDLLLLLVNWAQKTMVKKLTFVDIVQCTVLEVKVIEGHGTTIDVVLVNGVLHQGDHIVVCGSQGPIVTTIKALLTPHPMKELRVKDKYLRHIEVKAAQGIKIAAQSLRNFNVEEAKKTAMKDMESVMSRIDKSGEGVYVQASTLGSLEALLEFLKSPDVKIPVSGIGIGPLHKKDIMKAGLMLERKKEYATILAFDVKVSAEAQELADNMGVKIFWADIIYHLFDQFKSYMENIKEEKKKETACEAVFPCVLRILPNHVYNKRDPIILGVKVIGGILKVGTPICILNPVRVFVDIGRIASIENNNKPVDYAKKNQEVAIKIVASNPEEEKIFGRHFGIDDKLFSHISRRSIDILETNYRDELSDDERSLVLRLKKMFRIQ